MTMLNTTEVPARRRYRLARETMGLKQDELAARVGVSRTTIGDWERGTTEPSASKLIRLAQATNQPLDWFIEGLMLDLRASRDSNPQPSGWETRAAAPHAAAAEWWTPERALTLATLWQAVDAEAVGA